MRNFDSKKQSSYLSTAERHLTAHSGGTILRDGTHP